jgi:hypothetical protein
MFLGSIEAGPRAAVICTILAGAKRHRLEPQHGLAGCSIPVRSLHSRGVAARRATVAPRAVDWPGKRDVTFSDAITAVRRWLWVE